MNLAQRKYAIERVKQIEAAKLAALTVAHTREAKTLSREQQLDLIIARKVKLKTTLTELPTYASEAFDFSKFMWHRALITETYNPAANKVKADAARVRDQIMLGDAEAALALLADFSENNS
ncbi:hypothetical protein [Mesorhizobium sp. M7A.F.Ca.MR.362.00.0.0]|uniref:hypothetical protein n=1 Tax=Mesorhizobium sp. M7A.F.Ca.MR.362.00.0.0 TaxID=2496779 RepID=UPI000FD3E97D|nr:hypothetical protein [Mesorhizobium sp. M7A.F.Ca.MR.362.00.0.0]RUU80236.1 hypothetical protein EOC06_12950 [Mesorhizobium sp. M7A.F.Ca.MR.362.00.0.0]RWN95149.1 MAG: hypothetical protein EOS05_10135 [Mesorhizobium sp.]